MINPDVDPALQQREAFAHFNREDFEHRIGVITTALEGQVESLAEEDQQLLGQMWSSWVEYDNIQPLLFDPRIRETEKALSQAHGTTAEAAIKKKNMLAEWLVFFESLRDSLTD